MTSTRRGGGVQAQVDACGRGEGVQPHVDVHTENSVFFSCKEVGVFFTRISSLDRKEVEIFVRYKLVI